MTSKDTLVRRAGMALACMAHGPMFAFTPHGASFALPVTATLPFAPATVPAGRTPQLFKTVNGQTQIVVSGVVTSGSQVEFGLARVDT